MFGELERTGEGAVVAYLKLQGRHSSATGANSRHLSVKIIGIPVETRAGHLLDISGMHYCLSYS